MRKDWRTWLWRANQMDEPDVAVKCVSKSRICVYL
jgi:hypothetical protein